MKNLLTYRFYRLCTDCLHLLSFLLFDLKEDSVDPKHNLMVLHTLFDLFLLLIALNYLVLFHQGLFVVIKFSSQHFLFVLDPNLYFHNFLLYPYLRFPLLDYQKNGYICL